MVPGLGGHLVSEVFLETLLSTSGALDGDRARARLAYLRRQCASLGPATSPRALLETAAAPMVDLLGFEPPTDIAVVDAVVAATIFKAPRADSHNLALLVAPWGERLDPLWRVAVTEAMRRFASWGILFNGTHLRIVDPNHLDRQQRL